MNQPSEIDVGDYVHHAPSGEDWIVALVEGGQLYWCGYPFGGSADFKDCTLIKKSTDEFKQRILKEIADAPGSYRPQIVARERLK